MDIPPHEKRIHQRKPLSGEGELVNPVSGATTHIKLADISVGGLSFLSAEALTPEQSCLIRFPLGSGRVRGVIRIAYCAKHSLAEAYRVGAEFRGLEAQYLALVRQYIEKA